MKTSKTSTDMERAKQRALALGYRSVTDLLASRMRCGAEDPNVRSFRNVLSRGLKNRRGMEAAARLFDVPVTFWMETDPVRVRQMIDTPATEAPTTAADCPNNAAPAA